MKSLAGVMDDQELTIWNATYAAVFARTLVAGTSRDLADRAVRGLREIRGAAAQVGKVVT